MYCGKIISRRTMKKKEGDEERHINYHHYTHTTENNKEKAAVCLRRISYLLLLSLPRGKLVKYYVASSRFLFVSSE